MTPQQIVLVQQSFAKVEPIADTAASLFYQRLFEIDPSALPLFRGGNMEQQGRRLMQMIAVAVKGLNQLDDLVPAVQALGRRHAGYGVLPQHYSTVGAALLWTLGQGLGPAFTPEVETAWVETYGLLSTVMQEAIAKDR
ncbi:MAG: globin family protein [Pseudomonadota bacterium]